ncbi:MAG TPA: hypothetical protein VMN60_07235 [Longimicrobiales bacterium]|nr:hypothetical protein [Longimicrobiales bacterium]
MRRPLASLLFACMAVAACARTVAIQSGDSTRNYSIEITNETGVAMIVSYNDGRGDALLGTIAASRTERFIVAAPAATTISVRAVATAGGQTSGPHSVTLTAGASARLTLR